MKKNILIVWLICFLLCGISYAGVIESGDGGGGGTGTPGGANGSVQCNNSGSFGACSNLDDTSKAPAAGSTSIVSYGPTAVQAVTCTDSGDGSAGALTITPTAGLGISNISLTVSDSDGCTITMSETGAVEGSIAIIRNVSAANTATFTTSAGVLTLKNGSPYTQAAKETIWLQYVGSEWLEVGRIGSLAIASLNMTSGTYSIPWVVSTDCSAVVAEGRACWDSDDDVLYIGKTATNAGIAKVDGALGTPSFTALNMPSSNADPGTTAGQIKHDSTDTGANSGGVAKWYDGAQVRTLVDTGTNYTYVIKTEYLPIRYAEDGTTAPSAAAAVTGKKVIARSFSEGDDVVFFWVVPNDYVGGVKYRVHYALSADASADETVVYSMTGCIAANSADIACSAGTALTISDELGTSDDQYQYMVTDYSAESNADWSLTAGGLARLAFSNAAAGDLTSGEPLVIGIEIKYKAKIMGIADY